MIDGVAGWIRSHFWTGVRQMVALVSWSAVYLIVLLATCAGLVTVTSGWDAVVVTSGSMSPKLRAGDLLFIDEHPPEMLGQRSVITFRRPGGDGELVTHRVFETIADDEVYVTKGDANPAPDVDRVPRDEVVGVGRLVVPFVGLPVVWAAEGQYGALAALGLLGLAAGVAVVRGVQRRRRTSADEGDRFSPTAQIGISRVRAVVALMVAMQLVVDDRRFRLETFGLDRMVTLSIVLLALLGVSSIGRLRSHARSMSGARRLAMLELIGDTLLVVFFVAASGGSGIGWILMALPIIEAAIHFRLTGAFVHWMLMSGLVVAAFFWTNVSTGTPQHLLLDDLEQLVDRLGLLLLVVIPGSYLAEQLLGEVWNQRRATSRAHERSRIIEHVTTVGRDVTRLGGELFETLTISTLGLGFDAADIWIGDNDRGWRRLAASSDADRLMPHAGHAGSALRSDDLALREVGIDADDPDAEDAAAISDLGIAVLLRVTLAQHDDLHVALRVAAIRSTDDPANQIMALRLLCSQATVALQNEKLMAELRRTHAELEYQAMYDPLTGLANRTHFVGELSEALRAEPGGADWRCTTVMFLDLNGFKAVNDRLGHNAGDELLIAVGQRITRAVEGRGLVARLGGDEFTVLLDRGLDPIVADEIADAIHLALSEPLEIADDRAHVGTSIGIAHSEPFIGVSEILRRADLAMYTAKGSSDLWGTRTYRVELEEGARQSQQLTNDFSSGFRSGDVHLMYQPIVDLSDGAIVGVEALLRWTHPDLGPIPPPSILETADSVGLTDELNAWVFVTALSDIAGCQTISGVKPFVAVNVSPKEIELDSLVDNMKAALAATGVPPSRVVVELSERIVTEARRAIENVNRLCVLGVGLALDDFGQGQTALGHLRGLPIDTLKLDRVFVQNARETAEDRRMLGSVVSLAHDLGCSVIAEGIETAEQKAIVAEAGADLAQGFGLHRPMRIDALRRLLDVAAPAPLPGAFRPVETGGDPTKVAHRGLPMPERVG